MIPSGVVRSRSLKLQRSMVQHTCDIAGLHRADNV